MAKFPCQNSSHKIIRKIEPLITQSTPQFTNSYPKNIITMKLSTIFSVSSLVAVVLLSPEAVSAKKDDNGGGNGGGGGTQTKFGHVIIVPTGTTNTPPSAAELGGSGGGGFGTNPTDPDGFEKQDANDGQGVGAHLRGTTSSIQAFVDARNAARAGAAERAAQRAAAAAAKGNPDLDGGI